MKEYTLIINGRPHTFLLEEDDAIRRGAVEVKAAPAPLNKARAAQVKSGGR